MLKRTTIYIPEKLKEALRQYAFKHRKSLAEVIRIAIEKQLTLSSSESIVKPILKAPIKKISKKITPKPDKISDKVPDKKPDKIPDKVPGFCKHNYQKGLCKFGCK